MSALPDDGPIELNAYEFTQFAVQHKGQPIDLEGRPWLPDIYNMPFTLVPSRKTRGKWEYRRKQLMVFGRQCEKSTTEGNMLIAASNLIPYLRALYVTASNPQMREFSDERLRAVIADSPRLRRLTGEVIGMKKETQNVQTKRWTSQSKIVLRSAYRGADRVRGIAADLLALDEIQDIYTDSVPVIEETLSHSELHGGPISLYAGTPKTFDNTLEYYWSRRSTQNEWLTKCSGCGHWNVIEVDSVFEWGLGCLKCMKELDPVRGKAQWVSMGQADAEWNGFRLPQPIVVYAYRHNEEMFERKWADLWNKKVHYSRQKLMNEVLARSYDAGTKPVTFGEVRACALNDLKLLDESDIDRGLRATQTWAGVDWGTGDESYTVLSVWTYDPYGRFTLLFAKRYAGAEADPDTSINDIIMWCKRFNVNRIGVDWGFGFHANPRLQKAFGPDRVLPYFHQGRQGEKVRWDKAGLKFTTHRTRVLHDVFTLIKRGPTSGGCAFFNWREFETFANDIFSVYQEFSEARGELIYDHPKDRPDDFLHTFCYAFLASQFDVRRPDLHAPAPGQRFNLNGSQT